MCFYMYAQLISRIRYRRDQWIAHLLVLQTRVECFSRMIPYRFKPRQWVPKETKQGMCSLSPARSQTKRPPSLNKY